MNCFDLASQAAKKVDARKCPLCFMKLVNKEQGFFSSFREAKSVPFTRLSHQHQPTTQTYV